MIIDFFVSCCSVIRVSISLFVRSILVVSFYFSNEVEADKLDLANVEGDVPDYKPYIDQRPVLLSLNSNSLFHERCLYICTFGC